MGKIEEYKNKTIEELEAEASRVTSTQLSNLKKNYMLALIEVTTADANGEYKMFFLINGKLVYLNANAIKF